MKLLIAFFILCVGLLAYLISKQIHRIHRIFNSTLLSFYTPDNMFPSGNVSHEQIGMEHMKNSKLIIASLVRDVEERVPDMIRKCETTGSMFSDYVVLIVENDSKDRTRPLLLEWAKRNPKVHILGCGENVDRCKMEFPKTEDHFIDRKRIAKMVHLRNIYLKEIKEKYSHFDYVLMWDLDILGSLYLDGLADTMYHFATNPEASAICANGIYYVGPTNLYYDTYAHVNKGDKFEMKKKAKHDLLLRTGYLFRTRGDPLEEVNSCFSGATTYRTRELLDDSVFYDMTPKEEENLECEHVRLHAKLKGKIYMNPSNVHLIVQNL